MMRSMLVSRKNSAKGKLFGSWGERRSLKRGIAGMMERNGVKLANLEDKTFLHYSLLFFDRYASRIVRIVGMTPSTEQVNKWRHRIV
jgi:hypothetical protein